MKIAVLAWGSLLWSPRTLAVEEGAWMEDGPFLPIEFSRIASDGRLTLVIDPNFEDIQVYWKLMTFNELQEALENLQDREVADTLEEIGFVNTVDDTYCIRKESKFLKERIAEWCTIKKIDAVIWTDLAPKFIEKTNMEFNSENALLYLKSLEGTTFERAREYIMKAPGQTRTKYRELFEDFLNI